MIQSKSKEKTMDEPNGKTNSKFKSLKNFLKRLVQGTFLVLVIFAVWQYFKPAPLVGNWQLHLSQPSIAEFNNDETVTVHNVRNFRYGPTEDDMHPDYYDRTYDLNGVKQIWFVNEPFNENQLASHTFVSFEFENGDFLAISIEVRKEVGQSYSVWKGLLRNYPLIYVAADERDVVLLRANLRKDDVFVYPVKLEKSENARIILTDMLEQMNALVTTSPEWYNTLTSNCTSNIAFHINKLSPKRIPILSWQLLFTASSDELALERGLLDTDLPISEARKKYQINALSEAAGDVPEYSRIIRGQIPVSESGASDETGGLE